MNYKYYIDNDRIFEVEDDGRKFTTDLLGESISFLVKNQKELALHPNSQRKKRKLYWLQKNCPEYFL